MSSAAADTIVGVATGTPDGGVAVIRVSGPGAADVAHALCGKLPPARRASVRSVSTGTGVAAERALVLFFPAPGSYTGEDVLELQIHGGERNVQDVLQRIVALGVSAAAPGEFTRRAFLNGRLDLAQAEGIAAIVSATTVAGLDQARRLAGGELGEDVRRIRQRVLELRAEIEANLDFPDDVTGEDCSRWEASLQHIGGEVDSWLQRYEAGRAARERPRVVLAGPPNAGKSSLFNALLGQPRALVDARAGTTRDYVDALVMLGGREVWLVDTAGQREAADRVEAAGVDQARRQVSGADVVIWVEGADVPEGAAPRPSAWIAVLNKAEGGESRPGFLAVSAHTGRGLDALRQRVGERVAVNPDGWIGLARHRELARESACALGDARRHLEVGEALELVALALSVADGRLGEITGEHQLGAMGERVMDAVFSQFCIGK